MTLSFSWSGKVLSRIRWNPLLRKLGLTDIVTLLGRQSSAQVADLMRAVDLLCIPSDNEGLPNVLLEAFSCGLQVVSTDVGGIRRY